MNSLSLFDLTGEKAIVTGGGQGIGKAIALGLAEAGADVAICQRRVDIAEKTAHEISSIGREVIALKVDVRNSNEVEKMVKTVKDKYGKIDILVNNAAISAHGATEDTTEAQWDEIMDINMKGILFGMKYVGKEMIKQKKGSVINISSTASFVTTHPQNQMAYNASKGGVNMMTKSAAVEWTKYNVRVNAIAPGYIKTPMVEQHLGPGMIGEIWIKQIPMGRLGEMWELKGAALFLASKASTYVTGSIIVVDGGYSSW